MPRRAAKAVLTACILLVALVFSQAALASEAPVAKLGSTGTVVHTIHVRLAQLQFMKSVPAADKFSKQTQAAVKTFQTANGIKASGVVYEDTYRMLTSPNAVSYPAHIENLKDKQNVLGGKGEYVGQTQKKLQSLGYYSGKVNKKYTAKTKSSVMYFQLANNLPQTGSADRITRAVLFGDAPKSCTQYETETHIIRLAKNSTGAEVTYLQNQLVGYGYLAVASKTTGTFDAATSNAVSLIQEANGIKATGVATRETRILLNSGNAVTYTAFVAKLRTRQLTKGDTGAAVKLLQSRLKELYYYGGPISGKFDAATVKAVTNFQIYSMPAAGMTISSGSKGKVGAVTLRALYSTPLIKSRIDAYGFVIGDTGSAVREYQQDLYDLGYLPYYSGKVNGTVGTKTIAATKLFQKANGLTVSGVPTLATREKAASPGALSLSDYRSSTSSSAKAEKLVNGALKLLGRPYSSNANPPKSFDCSRFTKYCFAQVGVSLNGEVSKQYRQAASKYKHIASASALKRGDLVYFDTQKDKTPGHAAIWLGKVSGKYCFVHASSAKGKVVVSEYSEWYQKRFVGGVRVF